MPLPVKDLEDEGEAGGLILSMRVKLSLGGLCFLLAMGLVAHIGLPRVAEAVEGILLGSSEEGLIETPPTTDHSGPSPPDQSATPMPAEVSPSPAGDGKGATVTGWVNMAPAEPPSARGGAPLAYDSESDRIILFSGRSGGADTWADTWAYDFNRNTWTNMNPPAHPPATCYHGLAYDSESDRVILFGGAVVGQDAVLDITWAYDFNSNTWTDMNPTTRPSARTSTVMTYDSESDRVILFGGCLVAGSVGISQVVALGHEVGDTWTYDFNSNTWTEMKPSRSPPAQAAAGLTYHSRADRAILFACGQTWAYDYNTNTWTEMKPKTSPPSRYSPGVAYDSESDLIVLFGGGILDPPPVTMVLDDTWVYDIDANTWYEVTCYSRPQPVLRQYVAYDSESDRVIVFGGWLTGLPLETCATSQNCAYDCLPGSASSKELQTSIAAAEQSIALLKDGDLREVLAAALGTARDLMAEGNRIPASHLLELLDDLLAFDTSTVTLDEARAMVKAGFNIAAKRAKEARYWDMARCIEASRALGVIRERCQPLLGCNLLTKHLQTALSWLQPGRADTAKQVIELAMWCNRSEVQDLACDLETVTESWDDVLSEARERNASESDLKFLEGRLSSAQSQFTGRQVEKCRKELTLIHEFWNVMDMFTRARTAIEDAKREGRDTRMMEANYAKAETAWSGYDLDLTVMYLQKIP